MSDDPLEHRFSAIIEAVGGLTSQRVVLDGQNISRFVSELRVTMPAGELTHIELDIVAIEDGRPAIEFPEALCTVVMQDMTELLYARVLLQQAVDLIRSEAVMPLTEANEKTVVEMIRFAAGPNSNERAGDYARRRRGA